MLYETKRCIQNAPSASRPSMPHRLLVAAAAAASLRAKAACAAGRRRRIPSETAWSVVWLKARCRRASLWIKRDRFFPPQSSPPSSSTRGSTLFSSLGSHDMLRRRRLMVAGRLGAGVFFAPGTPLSVLRCTQVARCSLRLFAGEAPAVPGAGADPRGFHLPRPVQCLSRRCARAPAG